MAKADKTAEGIKSKTSIADWASEIAKKGIRPLIKEFKAVRPYVPENTSAEAFARNALKNRYL